MDNRIDAIYGRQSIDKKDSISIESQFEFCRYELKGGEAKEYKDKGYSGKNIERPDFQRLLKDIRAGLIRRVIVYKLDRISRSIVDFAKLMELFKQYMNSTMRGYIEADWYNNSGERYRCVRFSSTFNGNVKFCMKATDEVNSLICEACKPEWMKKSEAEAKQQVPKQNEVA